MDNNKQTLEKTYTINDIIFAGFGYIVGAGIFTLLPFIIKYSKGNTWLAFVLGGIISILTGLSYAKLNLELPSNDAEYTWINDAFTTKKDREEKNTKYKWVEKFARLVIYAVMALGVAMNAAIVISIVDLLRPYIPLISTAFLSLIVILIPSIVNIASAKYTATLNTGITIFTVLGLVIVIGLGLFTGKNMSENTLLPIPGNTFNLLHGVFITIFAFNGFQSLVQMSEEAKKKSDIPKGMIGSASLAMIFYVLIAIAVVSLFGVKKASSSISPIVDAFGIGFGKNAQHMVNVLAIVTMSSTLLLSTMSRSRLLKKLADLDLAPNFLSKLTETIKDNKMPVNAVAIVSLLSYMLTFVKGNALELVANLANTIAFFIFTCVNIAVVYKYHKDKGEKTEKTNNVTEEERLEPFLQKFKDAYPVYGILGAICTTVLFINSPKFYKIK
jgi:basic amino acid/polyamine antiporter, APA family